MGKKGTKRKTKWRALPLGEDAGGSGNEEEVHDDDQSTTSSVAGGQPYNPNYKRQSFYYKVPEKSYRQTRKFAYDRFRSKEPLVKLESKTFDEEEYTKITTPRQDVLFKKGYFGRKRESSFEENPLPAGESEVEESVMDQIIITNGFLDERGHYLVNGNSYEIYDPYTNTVTVVVGPPPYANGVTQPVLAAVSCQPVPLTPVDWYPPGADWPSQGSAWTPSYPANPPTEAVQSPDPAAPAPAFASPPNGQIPSLYNHQAYVVPGYAYGESPIYNGVPLQTNHSTEVQNAEENRLDSKRTRRKSEESLKEEPNTPNAEETEKRLNIAQETAQNAPDPPPPPPPPPSFDANGSVSPQEFVPSQTTESKKVEKQSHSTQTNLEETMPDPGVVNLPRKESHSTQTPPEETPPILSTAQEQSNKNLPDSNASPLRGESKTSAPCAVRQENGYATTGRKYREEPVRKITVNAVSSPPKVSYAKKAMSGLENSNPRLTQHGPAVKVTNGNSKTSPPVTNGVHQPATMNGTVGTRKYPNAKPEDRKNGFVKNRYSRVNASADRPIPKYKEKKLKCFEEKEPKREEHNQWQSEKSSTVSDLSTPTELSSGQNTPPEKLIQKMEEEINKSFEEKLKKNLTKTEEKKEEDEEEVEKVAVVVEVEEKPEIKPKEKKKKKKAKGEKEAGNGNRKKKKRPEDGEAEKCEEDTVDTSFLSDVKEKEFLFEKCWEGLKNEEEDFISEMSSFLNGDKEILKSLGLDENRISHSKLPLHSDLLVMLPTLGWTRPKFKIEDFFAPATYNSDLFTKQNITSMRSTKPEEFFASVIDGPTTEKQEKKKEPAKKSQAKVEESAAPAKKKSGSKGNKKKSTEGDVDDKREEEPKEIKLGIVEAVNSWLQEQDGSDKFVSVETLTRGKTEPGAEETESKNAESNPIHASSVSGNEGEELGKDGGGCMRVANVINDSFIHVSQDFPARVVKGKKGKGGGGGNFAGRMYRSTSWDAKLSETKLQKHLKFLTDSASFCQDLISDVRNGFPAGTEFATEELCDPKQTVKKYYTLSPDGRTSWESDSESEVFEALEYKFMMKENGAGGKSHDGNGNASITDSGVHSDMESTEENVEHSAPCKLQ